MPFPNKTDAILIVYPDAVLPVPVALKWFQVIARANKIGKYRRGIQHSQFPAGRLLNRLKPADPRATVHQFRIFALKRSNQFLWYNEVRYSSTSSLKEIVQGGAK